MDNGLLAAALSASTGTQIIKESDQSNFPNNVVNPLTDAYHKLLLVHGYAWTEEELPVSSSFQIFVAGLEGRSKAYSISSETRVYMLKRLIKEATGIEESYIRLIFLGKELRDDRTMSEHGITECSTIHIVMRFIGGGSCCPIYSIGIKLLDPSYHYDFTNIQDTREFWRGGFNYRRPCGWKRYAIRVIDKYGDNEWLGSDSTSSKVWPVSYHGTTKNNAHSIADDGYLLSKCVRCAYGRGIYSTPNIEIAEQYAQKFVYKNETFKVVLQNRVNPVGLQRIRISGGEHEYWLSAKETDVRPYGILIRRC